MTSEQLLYFAMIVTCGSFSEAAARNNVSQSSVSKQIQALENELGVPLFDRKYRGAVLTPVGEAVLAKAKTILADVNELMVFTHRYAGEMNNRITVVSLPFLGQYRLMEGIQSFRTEHPQTEIIVREMEENQAISALHNGLCDIAILRAECLRQHPAYATEKLTEDELRLFAPEGHPLAREKTVSPKMLDGVPLMSMYKHTAISQLEASFLALGSFQPIILDRARIETIVSSVESGTCCAILMNSIRHAFVMHHVAAIPLTPVVKSEIAAAYAVKPQLSAELKHLIEHLKAHAVSAP